MDGPEFAVLYRWTVEPEHEQAFVKRWQETTIMLRNEHGGLGSCLTRDANGDFIAFARWPNADARDAAVAARGRRPAVPGVLAFEETPLEVVADLLAFTK